MFCGRETGWQIHRVPYAAVRKIIRRDKREYAGIFYFVSRSRSFKSTFSLNVKINFNRIRIFGYKIRDTRVFLFACDSKNSLENISEANNSFNTTKNKLTTLTMSRVGCRETW